MPENTLLEQSTANTTVSKQPCAPCMLNRSQATSTDRSLRVQAAFDDYDKFRLFNPVPRTKKEYEQYLKWIEAHPRQGDITHVRIPTGFVPQKDGKPQPRHWIFTEMYQGINFVEVNMPGPYTPVCDGMHFPSLLNAENLHAMKAAGIDAIVIRVPGQIDAANAWARTILQNSGFSHLMPDSIPKEDFDYRLNLDPIMPRIMIQSDFGETFVQQRLITWVEILGAVPKRSFSIYNANGLLLKQVVAQDNSADKCSAVTGDAILATAQQLQAEGKLQAKSGLKARL